jgi:2-methylisocitrate lyase-like PEP mutase family enzyme
MTDLAEKARTFASLHEQDEPLLLANAWDRGSAKLLAALGFHALATTSSGHAASLGRLDYGADRDEVIAGAADIADATELPVSADLEDCFGTDPTGVARTVELAIDAGLAGCSIEDWGSDSHRFYEPAQAAERVAAAAEAAHASPVRLVLTARAENYIRDNPDLDDTIARLVAYEQAGADVLYAPGLHTPEALRELLAAVKLPVNVLLRPGTPSPRELYELGVKRISVGGAFAFVAYGAAAKAAQELIDGGGSDFLDLVPDGAKAMRAAAAASDG